MRTSERAPTSPGTLWRSADLGKTWAAVGLFDGGMTPDGGVLPPSLEKCSGWSFARLNGQWTLTGAFVRDVCSRGLTEDWRQCR